MPDVVVVLADGALQVVEVEEEDNMKASIGIFRIIPLIVLILYGGGNFLFAQNTLKVVVLDSATKAPVEAALFSVKYIGETNPKRHALTDSTGTAVIQRVPVGRAEARIDYVGYRTYTATVDVKRGANDIGAVYLASANTLSSITVSATGNQMLVKQDTKEFNASSFKVEEADMLEELIKKLPGVEIEDGKIYADGKEVKKIMIDGKTFFMDDPTLASKNIPAKIVEKIRLLDRQSDEARFTGIDDGEEETVLDLLATEYVINSMDSFVSEDEDTSFAEFFADENVEVLTGPDFVPVSSIRLDKASVKLTISQEDTNPTIRLTAAIEPANASDPGTVWMSDNPDIATVNPDGVVTAVGAGQCTITCTAEDGSDVSASCTVTVDSSVHEHSGEWTLTGHLISGGKVTDTYERICTVCGEKETKTEESDFIRLPGDVNEDGEVDGRDVIRLMKYLAQEIDETTGEVFRIVEQNADVNGDKVVNELDLLLLVRFLGGDDVELK